LRLAVFQGQHAGQAFPTLADQRGGAAHHHLAIPRRGVAPDIKAGYGGIQRILDVLLGRQRQRGQHILGSRIDDRNGATAFTAAPLAVDEQT